MQRRIEASDEVRKARVDARTGRDCRFAFVPVLLAQKGAD
jgi:hypothetical protein